MEESGSEGLDDLVEREAKPGGWFDNVDCVCIVRLSLSHSLFIVLTSHSPTTTG